MTLMGSSRACMRADRAHIERMLATDPTLAERAIAHQPDQLVRAAEKNSLDAVALLIDLGFDVNAINRTAPLHEAAMRGNLKIIKLLLAHGADPNIHDHSFDATPAGWADHHHQTEAQRYLAALEPRP
jgi:ankyrin repeat protein